MNYASYLSKNVDREMQRIVSAEIGKKILEVSRMPSGGISTSEHRRRNQQTHKIRLSIGAGFLKYRAQLGSDRV